MRIDDEISEVQAAIDNLKRLKSELVKTKKISDNAFNCNGTVRAKAKASANLNWQCMHLDKMRKQAYASIVNSCIPVRLEKQEYNPSGFHKY